MTEVLSIENLSVAFRTLRGDVTSVDDFSLRVNAGETVAIVGESGCGKSTTALAVLRLIQQPPGRITGGAIRYRGTNLLKLSDAAMRDIRGNRITMIFQDPMVALNPVHSVGQQIAEALVRHRGLSRQAAFARSVELLHLVGIPAPRERARQYPHNLSGGMRQRVMIAIALACEPDLIIADEPTTAVDVTVQAQILRLINGLQKRLKMAMLLITHDLGVVTQTADYVVVMYAGRKVEEGHVADVFATPRHPYTRGLLAAARYSRAEGRGLREIPGTVPDPYDTTPGCRFAPRCALALDRCRIAQPELQSFARGHAAACLRADEVLP